jgi:DNA mismatch repair protein MSH3
MLNQLLTEAGLHGTCNRVNHTSMSQRSISAFFKPKPDKRAADDDEVVAIEPPSKRPATGPRKTATSSYFGQAKPKPAPKSTHVVPTQLASFRLPVQTPSSTPSGSAFGSYTLGQAEPGPSARPRTDEQEQRRLAWSKRMEGGLIRRRRSLALDEAAAAEAREDLESGSDSDEPKATSLGSKLAKYAAGETKKGKKKEEVGPSGQTYTPLEKQFMAIKRDNPDVLLLMEVGYKYK